MRRTFTVWEKDGGNSNQAPSSLTETPAPRMPFIRAGFAVTPDVADLDMDARAAQGFGPTETVLRGTLARTPETDRLEIGVHFIRDGRDYELARIVRKDFTLDIWLTGIDHAY